MARFTKAKIRSRSTIADDEATSKMIRGLAKYHDSKRFKLQVYSTESGVRREKQLFGQNAYVPASVKRGGQTIVDLAKQKIPTWSAPTDGDIVSAAKDLAAITTSVRLAGDSSASARLGMTRAVFFV